MLRSRLHSANSFAYMRMRRSSHYSLWARTFACASAACWLCDGDRRIALSDLYRGSSLGSKVDALRGCSVVLATEEQMRTDG
jgi:hypothetical protein